VLCRRLCSSREIWVCRSPLAKGLLGRGAGQIIEPAGLHPSWLRKSTAASICCTYILRQNTHIKLDFSPWDSAKFLKKQQ